MASPNPALVDAEVENLRTELERIIVNTFKDGYALGYDEGYNMGEWEASDHDA